MSDNGPSLNHDGRCEFYTTGSGETVCMECGMDLTGCRLVFLPLPRLCSRCRKVVELVDGEPRIVRERIEKAALVKDGVVYSVDRPGRHNHAISLAHKTLKLSEDPMVPLREDVQGFVTNSGRFVDRFEAVDVAFKAGQITGLKYKLYSEDVWNLEGHDINRRSRP